MAYLINNRKADVVFHYFEEICKIPHGSYHEEKIADFIVRCAVKRRLFCYTDKANNVYVKIPATKGYENEPAILLQGHTDMVCEKNENVKHDFLKDPIELVLNKNMLKANGTTLGADDGIAVAIMLAIMDGAVEKHPMIECLFTASEEVGIDGANAFDYEMIQARTMINMDSEELGCVISGCAGGMRTQCTLKPEKLDFQGKCVKISIQGLAGGHSGENIKCGRQNAIKLMGRVLSSIYDKYEFSIVSISGGSKVNAIPRECTAVISTVYVNKTKETVEMLYKDIRKEVVSEDKAFAIKCEEIKPEKNMLSSTDTLRVLSILNAPNGVFAMSTQVKNLVEFSRNLGVVASDSNQIKFDFSSRSAIESQLDASKIELNILGKANNMKVKHSARYSGWEYAETSAVRDKYLEIYKDVTGKKCKVEIIHAGLECAIVLSHIPDMDIISVGPTMYDIHSPDERLDLDSVDVFFDTLKQLLEMK